MCDSIIAVCVPDPVSPHKMCLTFVPAVSVPLWAGVGVLVARWGPSSAR